MVTIKLHLDKLRSKSDNSYPLKFMIYHDKNTTTRTTGISINEEDWDENRRLVRKTNPQFKLLNQCLLKDLSDLQSELLLSNPEQVQLNLKPEKKIVKPILILKPTVYDFAQKLIDDLRTDKKIGNPWVYESTVRAIKGFHPENDLYFEHKQRLLQKFPLSISDKKLVVLNIQDDYQYMDEELIEILKSSVLPHVNLKS